MREIKFRAWVNEDDPEYSRMVKSEQAITTILSHKYGDNGVARPAGFSDIDNQPKPERYILMQYTGLKDTHGTEIYEGDILDIRTFYESSKLGQVEFADGAFVFDDGGYGYLGDVISHSDVIEVVGNIYESEYLIKNKGD